VATSPPETQVRIEGKTPSQGQRPQPLSGSAHARIITIKQIAAKIGMFKWFITHSDIYLRIVSSSVATNLFNEAKPIKVLQGISCEG
jgi:hypothetical protein